VELYIDTILSRDFKVKVLFDSIKFYLPRVEGYLEVVRDMASKYGGMSLIEFDGYFEGNTSNIDEHNMISFANKVRLKLKEKSLAIEFNNRLIQISEN
jgi:hypothetical protein